MLAFTKKRHAQAFVRLDPRCPLVRAISANNTQEPLNQLPTPGSCLTPSDKVCVCVFSLRSCRLFCLYTVRHGSVQLVFELRRNKHSRLGGTVCVGGRQTRWQRCRKPLSADESSEIIYKFVHCCWLHPTVSTPKKQSWE